MEITRQDNVFLDKYRGKTKTTQAEIRKAVEKSDFYKEADSGEIDKAAERIYNKLQIINSEYMQWFELHYFIFHFHLSHFLLEYH